MMFSQRQVTRCLAVGLSILFFAVLLVACGSANTPAPTAVTPTTAVTLQNYTGTGFTMGFPLGWKVQKASGAIVFTDITSDNAVTLLLVPNPDGARSASDLADASLSTLEQTSVKHAQPVANLSSTAVVDNETWAQRGTTGNVTENGQNFSGEVILLVNNHPASSPTTQAYEISYGGLFMTFQQENVIFQAMLRSFTFTS